MELNYLFIAVSEKHQFLTHYTIVLVLKSMNSQRRQPLGTVEAMWNIDKKPFFSNLLARCILWQKKKDKSQTCLNQKSIICFPFYTFTTLFNLCLVNEAKKLYHPRINLLNIPLIVIHFISSHFNVYHKTIILDPYWFSTVNLPAAVVTQLSRLINSELKTNQFSDWLWFKHKKFKKVQYICSDNNEILITPGIVMPNFPTFKLNASKRLFLFNFINIDMAINRDHFFNIANRLNLLMGMLAGMNNLVYELVELFNLMTEEFYIEDKYETFSLCRKIPYDTFILLALGNLIYLKAHTKY
ncbi:hypothetical protein EGR_03107 [Echinococcus granulosus]|uniref:Uncharacterized protein n=1 Tax=Echinococcus granulosus TaxID=6210 RepID=W6ULT0_ECHGR|nr:hypothetical protein EGR_03107 [Echinococcus granulosus]EUB62086.1 hypothetical protein EGR_03107 [Echinococcus granulosus]